jgi:hypothetical protein
MTGQFPDATKKALSPAAQAVLDAAVAVNDLVCTDSIAAALRAAADRLGFRDELYGRIVSVTDLLAIAAKLEAQ